MPCSAALFFSLTRAAETPPASAPPIFRPCLRQRLPFPPGKNPASRTAARGLPAMSLPKHCHTGERPRNHAPHKDETPPTEVHRTAPSGGYRPTGRACGKKCFTRTYFTLPTLIRYSAICTAFSAAPFLIWSPTSHNVMPFSLARSLRMRPTYTSSFPERKSGMG